MTAYLLTTYSFVLFSFTARIIWANSVVICRLECLFASSLRRTLSMTKMKSLLNKKSPCLKLCTASSKVSFYTLAGPYMFSMQFCRVLSVLREYYVCSQPGCPIVDTNMLDCELVQGKYLVEGNKRFIGYLAVYINSKERAYQIEISWSKPI